MFEWDVYKFEKLTSTNDKINFYCVSSGRRIVVKAKYQLQGRGRRGRTWISDEGNLFFSIAFEFELNKIGQLVVLSSLSLLQAIKKLNKSINVKLKWPNDVLINDHKVSGILLEKGEGDYVVIGIGVNIMSSPKSKDILYNTTSLLENGIDITADEFLDIYLDIFSMYLDELIKKGFDRIKDKWLDNIKGIGENIVIKQEKIEEFGILRGIDNNACLLIEQNGIIKKVFAGDVFYIGRNDE